MHLEAKARRDPHLVGPGSDIEAVSTLTTCVGRYISSTNHMTPFVAANASNSSKT